MTRRAPRLGASGGLSDSPVLTICVLVTRSKKRRTNEHLEIEDRLESLILRVRKNSCSCSSAPATVFLLQYSCSR